MRPNTLSIRDILLMTIATLALLIILLASKEVYVNWMQLSKIQSLNEAVGISDKLFAATEEFSKERDVAYTVLHAKDRETRKVLYDRLKENRRDADAALSIGLDALDAFNFPELQAIRSDIEAQLSLIHTLRRKMDEEIVKADMADYKSLSQDWFRESTALIVKSQDLWVEFSKHFVNINPIVTQHLRYKHFLRIISDYMGRQRAIIGRLIVENSDPTPQELTQLLQGQGIIELGWKFTRVLAQQSEIYDEIGPYYSDAVSHYQTLYGMVRDTFYVSGGKHTGTYPISVDFWLELSAQSKESFDALKDQSLETIHRYVESLIAQTQRAIALHGFLLLLALAISFYSFRVIIRRVINPINIMIAALVDAAQGKTSIALPDVRKTDDEIGKLYRVLNAFQESGERYRALVEASSQVIFTWKPDNEEGMASLKQWWENTTGLPGHELMPWGWAQTVHPDDREMAKKTWERVSATGEDYDMEYRIRAKNGQYRWVYVRSVGLRNPDGTLREFVGALTDITERKNAEEALRSYTRALERSNKELDDFAYIASHDLKEPLRGLFNHATFLLEDYKDKLDESGVHKLHRLSYLAQRMEKLVNDLLYFSRLGRQELAVKSTDINHVIQDIAATLEVFLDERHARIEIPKALPTVTCDHTRITEVFRNLITNAVKYNDKEAKTVEIGFLDSRKTPDGGMVRDVFYVKDNGRGIPPEFYDEVFRIFKRLQGTKDAEEGTGVGLTFVKKIIERHGGKIWIESVAGEGTVFYFTLGLA